MTSNESESTRIQASGEIRSPPKPQPRCPKCGALEGLPHKVGCTLGG